jgi:hypothetical protein
MSGETKAGRSIQRPYRVRLPRFISEREVGLGDAIKRATSFVGIRPCGGCGRRAELLNSWVSFAPRRKN